MNAHFLEIQLTAYLSLREALGFQMRVEKILLPEFVAFVQAQNPTGPVRAQWAVDWACQGEAQRGPGGSARRLSIARQFLVYLQASAPEVEVPDYGLLAGAQRSKPYLFTPSQIAELFDAARNSRPQGWLRPHTLSTLIGLLASTGLRVGEALRLQIHDVKLDLDPPQLHILQSKFRKSRIVPLHVSTAEPLQGYVKQRAKLHYEALSDAFFVSERGSRLTYGAVHCWFLRLCQRLAIQPIKGERRPCLISFRHTFAVTCLRRWYQQGLNVQVWLPHLSVYLGHIRPQESYWYLTAVPELLNTASERFRQYVAMGDRADE